MSMHNYAITYYGIAIPTDGSEKYNYIIKQLALKYKDLYENNDEYGLDTSVNNLKKNMRKIKCQIKNLTKNYWLIFW